MAYHYCDIYKYEYRAIKFAYMMMKSVALMEFTSDIKVLVENYQKETYLIDSYYRWFYHAYDKLKITVVSLMSERELKIYMPIPTCRQSHRSGMKTLQRM